MTTTAASPIRTSGLYSSSPSSLRSPAPPSSRSGHNGADATWTSPTSDRRRPVSVVAGAEGGAQAIGVRRRGSNSFKTMSTGSLVSNSPFTKRLGAVHPAPNSTSPTTTTNGASRIPQAAVSNKYGPGIGVGSPSIGRRSSGSRRASGEDDGGPIKENRNVSAERSEDGKVIFDGTAVDMLPRSRSNSPSVPFRPIRAGNPSASAALSNASFGNSGAPFKPSRPAFGSKSSSRDDVSCAGPVSTSHLLNHSAGASSAQSEEASPPLPQAPYEIAPLSHESAPFSYQRSFDQPRPAPTVPKGAGSPFSLGHRPGQASLSGERRFAGASNAPPNTPPHQRSASSATGSPSPSAMSPRRRGIDGPRAYTPGGDDDGDLTETEGGRALRRKPSSKTVTWAATEEVLEFEVDERRASGVSNASSMSDDARYYGRDDDEIEEGNSSMGFEEGGSVEVHDIESSDDDDESAVSTVDELIDNIDQFMVEERGFDEFYSPSQITSDFELQQHEAAKAKSPPMGYTSSSPSTAASSTFSTSTPGSSVVSDGGIDDAMSTSSYEDDATRGMARASESLLSSSPNKAQTSSWSPQRPLPVVPASDMDFLGSTLTMDSPGKAMNSSTFALPDIPGTSPLMAFEDDGTTGSVVTLDMAPPATAPAQASKRFSAAVSEPSTTGATFDAPRSPRGANQATPTQSPSKPTRDYLAGDSPILSAFTRSTATPAPLQLSPQLSRKGSVHSDVASNVSYYGSISSGSSGPIFMGRDRLDEKLSAHQALLGSLSPSSAPTGRFPDGPSSLQQAHSAGREIQARPAQKASSATLSTSMMPTIHGSSVVQGLNIAVGSPLTPQVAHAMTSPLDRLQKGVGRAEGSEWRNGDSLLGVAEVARGLQNDSDEEERLQEPSKAERGDGRPTRRRSLSTGDARVSETTSTNDDTPKKLELGFQRRLVGVPEADAFGMSTQSSLDDIFNSRNHSYRVRESKVVIAATDSARPASISRAGDLAASPAVRRKRPSNMHEINRSLSTVSVASTASRRSRAFRGQLFVHIREVQIEGVPMPRDRNNITFALDNGKQRVEAGRRPLEPRVSVKKEFELVCSPDLTFSIDLYVAGPPPQPIPVPQPRLTPPPPSPSKSPGGRLRALLSSPKKKSTTPSKTVAAPPMPVAVVPDPFYAFVGPDGRLASATLRFVDEALKCRHKRARITIPFTKDPSRSLNRQCSGSVTLDLFYLPTISGVEKASLPKSMDESIEGMRLAEYSVGVTHEGILTQLGGDCSVWRRRNMKLRGNRLVPYSEVTKMSHVEIDLSLVARIDDLNAPTPGNRASSKYDDEDGLSTMDHSFRLVFKDETTIDFYADEAESKKRWMKEIDQAVTVEVKDQPPQWAIIAKRQAAKLQT